MRKIIIGMLALACFQMSCSKDSAGDDPDPEPEPQVCTMETADAGCAVAYLEGQNGWVRILKQGNLADPHFMYPLGDRTEPYGTVTVFLENGNPVIHLNDIVLNDYLLSVSQSGNDSDAVCDTGINIETPDTADDSADIIRINHQVTFPFSIQLKANVCF